MRTVRAVTHGERTLHLLEQGGLTRRRRPPSVLNQQHPTSVCGMYPIHCHLGCCISTFSGPKILALTQVA
jgi:hypothetical protein